MLEQKLMSAMIKDRASFTQAEKFDVNEFLSEPSKVVYEQIQQYYDNDSSATSVDIDILKSRLERNNPNHFNMLEKLLNSLPEEVSSSNVMREIADIKKQNVAMEITTALTRGGANSNELMEKYLGIDAMVDDEEENDLLHRFSVHELVDANSPEGKIRLWPKMLQDVTEGAQRGHNILLFARPEVGKSLMAINMAGGFIHDGYKVLFIENEDPTKVTGLRLAARICGQSVHWVLKNPDEAQQLLEQRGYDRLILKGLAPGSFREIYQLVDEFEPDVTIINQMINLNVGRHDTVTQYAIAAKMSRHLAKSKDMLVINVAQAGDSADNKLVLEMGDIDFSNTGIPAQMDLIIGVGMNPEFEGRNQRMISLPKNKLSGRHEFFPVTVDPLCNKVIS